MITYDSRLLRWQDLHIFVLCWSGSLCLVVHISSKGAKADNTEGQQGKKKKGNQIRYRNFVCGRRSKSHGALSSSPASLLSYFPLALLLSAVVSLRLCHTAAAVAQPD